MGAIVTQNVDRLHQKAGSKRVIELHGSGYEVGCLSCKMMIPRHKFQKLLEELNPTLKSDAAVSIRPDGDVDIPQVINHSPQRFIFIISAVPGQIFSISRM